MLTCTVSNKIWHPGKIYINFLHDILIVPTPRVVFLDYVVLLQPIWILYVCIPSFPTASPPIPNSFISINIYFFFFEKLTDLQLVKKFTVF